MNALLEKTDKPVKRPNDEEYMISMADCVFKAIIQDLRFRRLLSLIIGEVTNYSPKFVYDNLKFINTELPVSNVYERKKITDILAEISGTTLNIEANRSLSKSQRIKNNLYHHKIATEQYNSGGKLEDCEVLQINFNTVKRFGNQLFTNFSMKSDDGLYIDEENFRRVHINMANPLKKYYNLGKESLSKVEKALVIFQLLDKKEIKKLAKGDEDLENMVKIIDDLNQNPRIIGLYDKEEMDELMRNTDRDEAIKEGLEQGLEQGFNQGIEKGLEQGLEQGISQGIKQIAKNMLKSKMDVSEIAKLTGLSETEIEKIKSEES